MWYTYPGFKRGSCMSADANPNDMTTWSRENAWFYLMIAFSFGMLAGAAMCRYCGG